VVQPFTPIKAALKAVGRRMVPSYKKIINAQGMKAHAEITTPTENADALPSETRLSRKSSTWKSMHIVISAQAKRGANRPTRTAIQYNENDRKITSNASKEGNEMTVRFTTRAAGVKTK
jgi:hypothetical protein